MKRIGTQKILLSLAMLFLVGGAASPAKTRADVRAGGSPQVDGTTCAELVQFRMPSVELLTAVSEASGTFSPPGAAPPGAASPVVELPAHCRVSGIIDRRTGVGGKPYGIHFEMRLPVDWNGRFLFQGGGAINGVVRPAIGSVKGPPALTRGFAVVTQDAGHEGSDASFGEDQQARIDMIYRSYERVTAVAKQIVAAYYGKPADRSYFMGCSEGGREALLASQRMPLEYDGAIAGDPGFLLGVQFQAEVDRLALAPLSTILPNGKRDYSKTFSKSDLALLSDSITASCDAGDGIKDGLIEHWSGCHPDLSSLLCRADKNNHCLSAIQLTVLQNIYEGTPPWTSGYPYDTGIAQPAWADKLAGGGRIGGPVSSVQGFFLTPYDPAYDDEKLDMRRDAPRFEEVGSLNRTDGVMVSSFKQRGGKLLIYTGLSDFAFSAKDLVAYYQRLAAANGGLAATQDFARLFLVPGMTHCRGGQSLDDFDPLTAVVDWVEHDKAPDQLMATGRAFPGRTRPLCAYPAEARYTGNGSADDAVNFSCLVPSDAQAK